MKKSPPGARRSSQKSSLEAKEIANTKETAGRGAVAEVLAYLSKEYVKPGLPWDEYIERMKCGLDEAVQQGISPGYAGEVREQWLRAGKGVRSATGGHRFSKRHRIDAEW